MFANVLLVSDEYPNENQFQVSTSIDESVLSPHTGHFHTYYIFVINRNYKPGILGIKSECFHFRSQLIPNSNALVRTIKKQVYYLGNLFVVNRNIFVFESTSIKYVTAINNDE